MFGNFKFNPEEHREKKNPYNQQNVDVRLFPAEAGCLVPRKVKQDHGCDSYGCTKQIKTLYFFAEGKILILFLEWDSRQDKVG